MPDLERTYIIPLRKACLKVPKYDRTKKAVRAVRNFLKKHMKSDNVSLGIHLNEELHKHGRKHPPHKIEVKAIKMTEKDKVIVKADLPHIKIEKIEKKKTVGEKIKEKFIGKEVKEAEIVEDKKLDREIKEVKEEKEKKEVLEHEKLEKKPMQQPFAKAQSKQISQKLRRERVVTATGKK